MSAASRAVLAQDVTWDQRSWAGRKLVRVTPMPANQMPGKTDTRHIAQASVPLIGTPHMSQRDRVTQEQRSQQALEGGVGPGSGGPCQSGR